MVFINVATVAELQINTVTMAATELELADFLT
jgi:hypothetical protein